MGALVAHSKKPRWSGLFSWPEASDRVWRFR
jgi:hypothetical protein